MTSPTPAELIRTDWFGKWASYTPDATAFQEDGGRVFTYGTCARLIARLARRLRSEFSVGPGDRVAVLAANEAEYILLFFALQKLEAVLVPLNWRLAPPELSYLLADADPRLFIHQTRFAEAVSGLDPACLPGRRLAFDGPDSLVSRIFDETLPAEPLPDRPAFAAPCMILYTSGTTGRPKGAIVTNEMLFWNSINTTMRLNIVQTDVTLTFAPFFHTGGWNVLTTPFLHRGARLVLLPGFDPDRVLELCDTEGVTLLFGVPTMMDMMARSPLFPGASLESVRYAIVGGEPMPLESIRRWHAKGVPIRQGYGLTEFGPNVFSLSEKDAERKIGSIGFPNFYVDARVTDDDGRELPTDEVGELALRGPVCTPGYWRNDEATAEAVREGWFHTGDLVRRDAEGYFFVVDRKKDMFISGAENVYPAEVERVLRSHPSVRDAAVVGVPDPKWGETGRAFVVLEDGAAADEDELRAYCRDHLAKFKVPSRVSFLPELPVSDSGKVLKRALKEMP